MREEPRITHEELRACLQEQYGLVPATIDFLPLGADISAAVYRVVNDKGAAFFLKIKSNAIYPPSCLVPHFLSDQGIESVVGPLPTKSHALWTHLGEWSVVMNPYIDGDSGWDTITWEHWKEAGRTIRRIHEVTMPAPGFDSIRDESFDPSGYSGSVDTVEAQLEDSRRGGPSGLSLGSSWSKHRSTIHALLSSLHRLAGVLQTQSLPYVICHADLHPGNLLRNRAGQVFVVDWDDVMLAPRERDFIFVGEPEDISTACGSSPFFEGYGQLNVNWIAVTYYRYERVVQDLIEYARDVLREDLTERTKSESLRRFSESLEGRNFKAAQVAAGYVPSDLTISGVRRDDLR
jgi:spectinomycin phosphotransferase